MDVKTNRVEICGLDLPSSEQGPTAGFCGNDNKSPGPIRGEEFVNYCILKKEFVLLRLE